MWLLEKFEIAHVAISFFKKRLFFMLIIFKVFIEFVSILLLFYVLALWLQGVWDLGILTRD